MRTTDYGEVILNTSDVLSGLYSGKIVDLNNIFLDDPEEVKKFNQAIKENFDKLNSLKIYQDPNISIDEFDKTNQSNWFMPDDYCPNLMEYLYGCCTTAEQIDRVNQELELFSQHGMIDLLFYLKYLVDTMREHKIVWGVGRGSSVASYVLFLIGVHKVDSIKYELDIHEFLK